MFDPKVKRELGEATAGFAGHGAIGAFVLTCTRSRAEIGAGAEKKRTKKSGGKGRCKTRGDKPDMENNLVHGLPIGDVVKRLL